ncbi:MAG: hypothetical protein D6834_03040 [Aquificota bacterium]|nr:MAG: hypothetical protein D6834_03040 [Aquificota bacterium]
MLFKRFLSSFKEYNQSILKSNQKEIMMLILILLNQLKSIKASGLREKYLKRIYRFFDKVDDQILESIQAIYQRLAFEIFLKWYQMSPSYRRKHPIIISVDDSVIEKFGKHMEGLKKLKSSDGRFVRGYSLLAITIAIGSGASIPIRLIWHNANDKQSKIQLAYLFLRDWLGKLKNTYQLDEKELIVAFDSWYLSSEMVEVLNDLKVSWISKMKKNWRITAIVSQNSYPVRQLGIWKDYLKVVNIKVIEFFYRALKPNKVFSIWHKSISLCYATQTTTEKGKAILVSNTNFKHKSFIKYYRLRWKIEVFFKEMKQVLLVEFTHFTSLVKNLFLMDLKFLVYTILQMIKYESRKYKSYTTRQLLQEIWAELNRLTPNSHNSLEYLQLHIINKSQNPFEALYSKA